MAEFNAVTDSEFLEKRRRPGAAFRAESASFDQQTSRLIIQLSNGVAAEFPIKLINGLETASPETLSQIEVQGRGFGLHFPLIDADISISQLFADVLGSSSMLQAERRMVASRNNGLKGGRPKGPLRASISR